MTEAGPRLHGWAGSIRFRLTVLYSVLLFGLATVVVGGIYAGVARSLDNKEVSRTEEWVALFQDQTGQQGIATVQFEVPDYILLFERTVNEQALDQLRTYAFGALGLLFVGSLFVGWFVAGLVLRPVGRITSVAREIGATDLSRRIELDGPDDELKQLADTFDGMLGRIDDAFESQREFIHEASHELRNPLAVIRTNIDVVLDDPDATEEDLRSVSEVVGRSAERMSTLVDDLLLYARHGTRQTRREDVDLVAEVEDLVEEFGAAAEANGLMLVAEVPSADLPVRGDAQAIHRAAANLLANAVRLAPAGTTVRVTAADEGRWVTLAVIDEGPGIDAEDQLRVFQRFWRADTREARTAGRSGLGLTIVRQIAEAHGGRVELESTVGEGSKFTLRFPRG
ncbi:MAG: signal transduction histidine kinase [Candidatus Aldehydirespiratoraceae bacterium]|jgi:signal transduction histidine kinase